MVRSPLTATSAYREEEKASLEASRIMVELFRAMNGDDVDEAVGDDAPTTPAGQMSHVTSENPPAPTSNFVVTEKSPPTKKHGCNVAA